MASDSVGSLNVNTAINDARTGIPSEIDLFGIKIDTSIKSLIMYAIIAYVAWMYVIRPMLKKMKKSKKSEMSSPTSSAASSPASSTGTTSLKSSPTSSAKSSPTSSSSSK